ncbi:cation transporter [Candidatus Peregrinibacteria bacterium]|nr:cation transporter [Candidatus Peregrinibacteria bacterium]
MSHEHRHGDRSHEEHGHTRTHCGEHAHTHGVVDPSIASSKKGLWAVKWSFIGLFITACLQVVVVILSGSVALLADTIHNFGDTATAIPLGIAFFFARLRPTKRFSYGYGRVEDLAGMAVVLIILFSAIVAGYEAIDRFIHPQHVKHLWAVVIASIVGFLGNEGVALFRLRVGKEIRSAALIADGCHARTDGWTSLAVLFGALGVWLGFPLTDPLIGLGITVAIFFIVWDSVKAVFLRALDGVEPEIMEEITHAVSHVTGVQDVSDVRARWIGHKLHLEMNIAVESSLSVTEGHEIANDVQHELYHHINYLSLAVVHVDPTHQSGERYHPHASLRGEVCLLAYRKQWWRSCERV